jgi:hypothetical protein
MAHLAYLLKQGRVERRLTDCGSYEFRSSAVPLAESGPVD